MEHVHVDAAADSAGGIGPFPTIGHGFLAQLEESYEQFNMEEFLDVFTQSYTAGAGGMGGGMGFSDEPFFGDADAGREPLVLIDVDSAGLLPLDSYPAAGDAAGMASFLQQGFGPIDDDDISNAGLSKLIPYPAVAGDITGPAAAVAEFPPPAFTSPDDNGGLPLLVPYPAEEIVPSTSGFSWLECSAATHPTPASEIPAEDVAAYSAAGLFALAAGLGIIGRLEEEEDAPLLGFGGLNSDQVCLSILGSFRRALDEEEEQQLQRNQRHKSLAQMGPDPSEYLERGAPGRPSRARRGRAVTAGRRDRGGTGKSMRQLNY